MSETPILQNFRQMVADLKSIAATSEESIHRLAERLSRLTGFISDYDFNLIVREFVPDEGQAAPIVTAIQNLNPASLQQTIEGLDQWRHIGRNREHFTDSQFQELSRKLPVLIQAFPAIDQSKKAKWLRNIIGNELQGFAFICDARPVYNESRDRIDGMIPLITLKLVYEKQNLERAEVELCLTAMQVKLLIAEAAKAEGKLDVLKTSIEQWIPSGCIEPQE